VKEFISLCESRNFSVCSDILYISQPTLTRHIQELEKELGTPLFKRTAKGVTLNEAGELFLPYAKELLKIHKEYTFAISQYLEQKNGAITIGSVFAIPQYGIGSIIGCWSAEMPSVKLKIIEADSWELFTWLRQGVVDCAFAREDFPDENGDFNRINITSDHLVCLVPARHWLADADTVSISQLKDEKILYYEKGSLIRNLLLGAGISVNEYSVGVKGRNALALVKQGLGIMLEFRKPIDDSELGGFSILDIAPPIRSEINFIYNPKQLTDTGRMLTQFVKNYKAPPSTPNT